MVKKIYRFAAAVLLLTVCALLCSCSGKTQEASTEEVREMRDFTLLGNEKAGAKNVYLIIKNLESSYWKVIVSAAEDAGEDMGCNVYYTGTYVESDWETQNKQIDIALSRGADAIILAPNDSVKLSAKVNEVYQAGIPIILVDTVVNTEQYSVCYMTDNLMAGQEAAEEMLAQLKARNVPESEPVKVAIQVGYTSSQTISERLAGFCQYWSHNAPANWTILDEIKCNEGSVDNAVKCAEEFFDNYSGIGGVFGCNNGSTVGFARVVLERQLRDVTVIGFDYSSEMAQLVNDSSYSSSTMLQRQYDMCYDGVRTALDMLESGFTPDSKFVDTGVIAVRNSNLDEPEVISAIERN